MPLLGHLDQMLTEFWVCNLRQCHHPLVNTLSGKVGDTVFCYDKIDIAPRCGNTSAFAKVRNNAGNLPVLSGGRKGDNGEAALRHRTPMMKIDLITDPAVELISEGVRTHLSGQIHLERRTYRNQFVVLS